MLKEIDFSCPYAMELIQYSFTKTSSRKLQCLNSESDRNKNSRLICINVKHVPKASVSKPTINTCNLQQKKTKSSGGGGQKVEIF